MLSYVSSLFLAVDLSLAKVYSSLSSRPRLPWYFLSFSMVCSATRKRKREAAVAAAVLGRGSRPPLREAGVATTPVQETDELQKSGVVTATLEASMGNSPLDSQRLCGAHEHPDTLAAPALPPTVCGTKLPTPRLKQYPACYLPALAFGAPAVQAGHTSGMIAGALPVADRFPASLPASPGEQEQELCESANPECLHASPCAKLASTAETAPVLANDVVLLPVVAAAAGGATEGSPTHPVTALARAKAAGKVQDHRIQANVGANADAILRVDSINDQLQTSKLPSTATTPGQSEASLNKSYDSAAVALIDFEVLLSNAEHGKGYGLHIKARSDHLEVLAINPKASSTNGTTLARNMP